MQLLVFIAFVAMSLPYSILPTLILTPYFKLPLFLSGVSSHKLLLIIIAIYPLGMFLGGYTLGRYADIKGKRKTLILSLSLSILAQIVSIVAISQQAFIWFCCSRFISGFFEGNVSIARAAIATLCHSEGKRKINLAYVNAALTLGWVLGPPLGAFAYRLKIFNGFIMPFCFAVLLTCYALVLTAKYFTEPPVHTRDTQRSNDEATAQLDTKHLIILLAISFTVFLGVDAFYIFIPVYLSSTVTMSPLFIATSSMLVGLSNILSNLLLLPRAHKILTTRMTIVIFPSALGLLLIALAITHPSYHLLYLMPLIGIAISFISPNISTYLSMKLQGNQQGRLMGALLSQRTLGTVTLTLFFAALKPELVSLPFYFGAVFLLVGSGLFFLTTKAVARTA